MNNYVYKYCDSFKILYSKYVEHVCSYTSLESIDVPG